MIPELEHGNLDKTSVYTLGSSLSTVLGNHPKQVHEPPKAMNRNDSTSPSSEGLTPETQHDQKEAEFSKEQMHPPPTGCWPYKEVLWPPRPGGASRPKENDAYGLAVCLRSLGTTHVIRWNLDLKCPVGPGTETKDPPEKAGTKDTLKRSSCTQRLNKN